MRPILNAAVLFLLFAVGAASPVPIPASSRTGSPTFSQQAYLKAALNRSGDVFGYSVAISGDTAVIGAFSDDSNATGVNGDAGNSITPGSGAAYIFVRNGTTWTQQAYLKASNGGTNDNFGYTVAISGDTVVIGAYGEDSDATGVNGDGASELAVNSGAAYVFVREGTTWSQQAYLKASNAGAGDFFGIAVSVSDDTAVIGAYGEDSNAAGVNGNQGDDSVSLAGAAYVFVRTGTTWTQQAYLKASNPGRTDQFGFSVDVAGETIVVGALGEDSDATGVNGDQGNDNAAGSGAAYVFVRSGTTWTQQAYLKAGNTGGGDAFGNPVRVAGDTVVVGAGSEDGDATGVNGNGANDNALNSGAAYVFARNGTAWTQQAYLKASNTGLTDQFGFSVAVSEDTVAIGAVGEDSNATGVDGDGGNNAASASGAAYVFTRNGTAWTQQAYLKAGNTGASDGFGQSVAIADNTVLVGANGESSNATGVNGDGGNDSAPFSGAAYVFTLPATAALAPIASVGLTGTGLQFTLPVAAGQTVGVEYSEALPTGPWLDIGNVSVANGTGTFTESDAARAGKSAGFYRAFLR